MCLLAYLRIRMLVSGLTCMFGVWKCIYVNAFLFIGVCGCTHVSVCVYVCEREREHACVFACSRVFL